MKPYLLYLTLLFCTGAIINSNASTYYAIQNGDWDDTNTWSATQGGASCSCIPGATDNVIIDGYRVDVDAADVTINSIVVTANVRNAPAHLRIENGYTLTVTTNITVSSPNNLVQPIELILINDNSTISILGNLSFSRAAGNTADSRLGLSMTNNTDLIISGDMIFDYLSASSESYDEINLQNSASLSCQNLYITFSGGTDFNLVMADASTLAVSTNFDIDINGGDDFLPTLSNTSGTNHIYVGGDMNINKAGGNGFLYTGNNVSQTKIAGDLYFSTTGISGPDWENIVLDLNNNSIFDVDGNFIYTMDIGGAFNQNNYLILNLDDDSKFYVGDAGTPVVETFTLNMLNGWGYDFYLDANALLQVYGDMNIDYDLDGSAWFYLNQNVDGTGADAQFKISNDLNVDIDGLGLRNFRIYMNNDSDFEIGNDMIIDMVCTGDWLAYDVNLSDEAGLTIGRDFLFTMNNSGKEYETKFSIDGDAFIDIGRNNTINFTSDHSYGIYMNANLDGSVNDAQYNVGGNLSFTQTKGSSPLIEMHYDSDINVTGDFTYTINGYENAWETMTFDLDGNAMINVDGNATISNYGPGTEDEYSYFYLDGKSGFNIGNNFTINHTAGDNIFIHMNQTPTGIPACDSAKIIVGGNFQINKTDGDEFHFLINEEALIDVEGDFDINITGFDADSHEFDFDLEDNSKVDVTGDFDYSISSAVNSYSYFNIEDNAIFEVGIGTGDLSKSMTLNSVNSTRDLQFDIDDNATLRVYGDLNMEKTIGQNMYFHLNTHSGSSGSLIAYGDLSMNNTDNDNQVRIRLNGTSSLTYIYGNIDLTGAASANRVLLEVNSTSEFGIGGNFLRNASPNNYGILDCNDNSTFSFIGISQAQNWPLRASDDIQDFTFQNVKFNNTFGTSPHINLQENIDYLATNRTVDFTDGVVNATAFRFQINNTDPAAIFNHSIESYVTGDFRRYTSGLNSYDFPVGSVTQYELANINFLASTPTYIDATFTVSDENPVPSSPYLDVDGTPITEFLNYGYWTITPNAGTPEYDITLTSRGHTNGAPNPEQHAVFKRDPGSGAGTWASVGTHDNATQSGSGVSPITAKRSSLTGFSDFIIGRSTVYNLPVNLLEFDADWNDPDQSSVMLNWITSAEINNDYFEIEKSENTILWETVGIVNGAGNSNQLLEYQLLDMNPYDEITYYRLRQYDYNGSVEQSPIVYVNKNPELQEIIIEGNPAQGELNFNIISYGETDIEVIIVNNIGQIVFNEQFHLFDGENQLSVNINHLATGSYVIHARTISGLSKLSKLFVVGKK